MADEIKSTKCTELSEGERTNLFQHLCCSNIRWVCHTNLGGLYVAQVSALDRLVLLKKSDLGYVARHRVDSENPWNEVRLLKQLTSENEGKGHPNVVRLLGYWYAGSPSCLLWSVLEDGGMELFQYVKKHGAIPEPHAREIARQVALALQFIHHRGICHLDVGVENILVQYDPVSGWHARLCDFGMASRMKSVTSKTGVVFSDWRQVQHRTERTAILSPEALAGGAYDGRAADVFAWAVALFTMLVGHPPFGRADATDDRFMFVCRGKMRQLVTLWNRPHLSDDVIDAMSCVLSAPETSRWTVDQVLAHRYFTQHDQGKRRAPAKFVFVRPRARTIP